MFPESKKTVLQKLKWLNSSLLIKIHLNTVFFTVPSNPHTGTESEADWLWWGSPGHYLTEPTEGTVYYRTAHCQKSTFSFFVHLFIIFLLFSYVMHKKIQEHLFHFLFPEQKMLLQFLFGHVLIFLPNLGQGGLEISLIDSPGNCSQIMNTIK